MIVDGRQLAREVLARTKARAERLHTPRVVAIVGKETPATLSYLRIKGARAKDAGCLFETRPLGAAYDDADAVIVQLPLPDGASQREVLDALPLEKDADVLSAAARTRFERGETDALLPPVVGALQEIFERYYVDIRGKHAVVIGSGFLVGAPVAAWLRKCGAKVEVLDRATTELTEKLRMADIIVSGAGAPRLITPDMLSEGVVLVDAATSESNGEIVGDADPSCASKCALFTPVPGGVGPLAVAKLFENAVTLAERRKN